MSQDYRFSPISSRGQYDTALKYLTDNVLMLTEKILGRRLALDTLTLFAHFDLEYDSLAKIILSQGSESELSHGLTLYVDTDIHIQNQHIRLLGVRKPYPSRPQVGYGDFSVSNYDKIYEARNPYIQEITSGTGKKLLEIRHSDFDVLAYIVRAEDHE